MVNMIKTCNFWTIIVTIYILCITLSSILSARILAIVSMPSYSHQSVFYPIWRELSLRGHQVVLLTTDPIDDPTLTNLTEINLHYSYNVWKSLNLVEMSKKTMIEATSEHKDMFARLADYQLRHPEVQALIKNKTEYFDLVMVENHVRVMFAFSERFKCPFIIISSYDTFNVLYEYVGIPENPVLYPDVTQPFIPPLTFIERLTHSGISLFVRHYFFKDANSKIVSQIETYFGNNYSSIEDITRKVSMMFVNADNIFFPIRLLNPAVVQIGGGIHMKKPKPLPKDLQVYLDGATEGAIYFNLGSSAKCKHLEERTIRIIIETFRELPYKILWKFELDNMYNKPPNVFLSKWFPQQDILRHPNIKLFITQGGYQSLEEALYSHVPTVVIPIFGDQPKNAKMMVKRGISLSLDYRTLNKQKFKETILEVINNETYRNTVKKLAAIGRDHQNTGLERAVWWTEYVLRHNGAHHLRESLVNVPFYQIYLWDMLCFCLLCFIILFLAIIFISKYILKFIKKIIKSSIYKKEKTM